MKIIYILFAVFAINISCTPGKIKQIKEDDKDFVAMLNNYFDERMQMLPLEATQAGDNRFNNLLPANFTDSYRTRLIDFFNHYKVSLNSFDRERLNDNNKISYDILKYEIDITQEGLIDHHFWSNGEMYDNRYFPFDQFSGVPLLLGQMGSGTVYQPFKTVADYDNWLQRASAFGDWADSAIVYFRKGIIAGFVLPKEVVLKMIPQMQAMVTDSAEKSRFYEPVKHMPSTFSDADKSRLAIAFTKMINSIIIPSYKKLKEFLQVEYLPKARSTSGINALPDGDNYYSFLVKYWTTTNKTPNEIYQTGISEVNRIKNKIESIKTSVKFKGDIKAFFEYIKTNKQFMPFKSDVEVLDAYRNIQSRISPNLKKLFTATPNTKFEIRPTESFRAASASPQYYPGLPDGTRPGIFYVPIVDAAKYNSTDMESLFLHEAIPGHHYQISLQAENSLLPKFRRFGWYGAYGEGYALYVEGLGKELGLYSNPYQQIGSLSWELHRAIRLVVDTGIHMGKMTSKEAIRFMMDNESCTEEKATAEIARYMVLPGQALSYKTGELKIKDLRGKYENQLGDKFSLSNFHDELLKDGCMPLAVLENKMDNWANRSRN